MKLIRWVEVHIGRSRRKGKKEKDALTINCGPDIPRRRDESTPSTPLRKIEPLGKDLPRSAGNTPQRMKYHPPSPHPLLRAPETPTLDSRLHIRTSFLDPGMPGHHQPLGFGSSTALDGSSPRVRCRIRTNPWLPSPKSGCSRGSSDCGWGNGIRTSSIGSESSESIAGSGFGSQSSGSLWEGYSGEPWNGLRLNGRSPSTTRLPRVTLERSGLRQRPVIECERLSFGDDEDKPYCPASYCRPIPRSAWMDFREVLTKDLLEDKRDDDESSDEAYSEDYVQSEEQDELPLEVMRSSKSSPVDTGSPQADSACGSDRDNSSCSTTPLSETPASSATRKCLIDSKELFEDKVQRLRMERHMVDQRMKEARAEEIIRREEQLILQRELVQFRRLLLLQTLSDLRNQLERQEKRLHRTYEENKDDKISGHLNAGDNQAWLQDHSELVG